MPPSPLRDRLIFLAFAPIIVPIALNLGLRDKPWTVANVRGELARYYRCYLNACERNRNG